MQIVRRLLERGTRGWVVRRRLPAEFGHAPIYVSPSARLGYLLRQMSVVDPPLLAFVRRFVHPGAVVWDVGATVGLYTFAAGQALGRAAQFSRSSLTPGSFRCFVVAASLSRRQAPRLPSSHAPFRLMCRLALFALRVGPEQQALWKALTTRCERAA